MVSHKLDVSSIIPHEDSFRLVDKVLSMDSNERSLRAMVSMPNHLNLFRGHYSQEQIVPGVIILEALSQCSILCGHTFLSSSSSEKQIHLTVEVQCRFKKPVHYQDEVLLYSKIENTIEGLSIFKVKALDLKTQDVYASGKIMGIALAQPL